jgi:PHD/YefM family antitoxin component YafN of YafNO toxin-antitoxin module
VLESPSCKRSFGRQGHGAPVVILHHDEPAFYAVPTDVYEMLLDKLDDIELAAMVREREKNLSPLQYLS